MMEPPQPQHTGAPTRYDDLLRQIVQLNTDLQKTAALSQTLQRERDGLQHNNSKVWMRKVKPCGAAAQARALCLLWLCVILLMASCVS